jgi:CheY-like chemotaxis protein
MDDNIPEEQLSDIHIINQSGEHLLKLINDVLEMSKIESGTIALAMDDAAIQPMLEDVVTLLSPHAETKGIQLTLTLDDKCPDTVFCDINKLRQVVINLIGNAIKFTDQGHVQIRLSLAMMKKNELLIEVHDSGPGIENDDLSRVFMPFEQIIRNATTGGTGLGLSISKQFVELMGGEITVASGIGQGCIFTVHLPLRHNNAVTETQHAADKSLKLSPETRVLVVEDQKENQLLFIKMLNQAGCQSRLAENGVQAIQLYEEWQPDVILMDRKMPVMDGLEATQIIRTLSKGDQVIIIGVTASAFKEEQNELISAGMDAVMAKPFKLEALSQLILELLDAQE